MSTSTPDAKSDKKPRHYAARDDHRALFFSSSKDPEKLALIHRRTAKLLGIPDSMVGATLIVAELPELVACARRIDPALVLQFDLIDEWIAAFNAVSQDHPFAQIKILSKTNRGKKEIAPPFKGIRRGPESLWTALWRNIHAAPDRPTAISRRAVYGELKALFLCSVIRARLGFSDGASDKRIYDVALLLRDLRATKNGTELDLWTYPTRIIDKLKFLSGRHSGAPKGLKGRYGSFADLLNQAYCLKRRPEVPARPYSERLSITRVRGKLGEYDLIYDDYSVSVRLLGNGVQMPGEPKPVEVEVKGPGKADIDAIVAGGACPDEFTTPDGVNVNADDLVDEGGAANGKLPKLATLFAAARGRSRAEKMRAQSFVTRRGRPRLVVIGKIITTLQAISNEPAVTLAGAKTKDIGLVGETARLAAVCLLNGAKPEEAMKLLAFENVANLPSEWSLAYSPVYKVWLRPYLPPDRHPKSDEVAGSQLEVQPRIALSDVWSVGHALGVPREGKWFTFRISRYREVYEKFIRPRMVAAGVPNDWTAIDMIGNILPAWFDGLEEGEALRNDSLFGRESSESATQRHYVALDRPALDVFYRRSMRRLWSSLKLNGLVANGKLFALRGQSKIPDTLTGSDWAPKISSIRELLVLLRERIAAGGAISKFERHNLIVAYLGVGLSVSMAFRDACTPITNLRLIDPETGFAPVQEKDFSYGSHARLVWVPLVVREVADDYLGYLRGLWVSLLDRPVHLLVKPTKSRDRRMFGNQAFKLSLLHTLFMFEQQEDGGWQTVEFTGGRLMRFLNKIHLAWTIPNAGRHLAATQGFNAGTDAADSYATVVRALLGHWSHGQGAWAPDSAFDPYRYREAISPVIERIISGEDKDVGIGFKRIAF